MTPAWASPGWPGSSAAWPSHGRPWWRAAACPTGPAVPYLPLFELVRNTCGIAAGESPDLVATKIELQIKALELDVSLAHYLRHAFGVTTGDPGLAELDPQDIRAGTFEALGRLLVAEAGRRALVILIEDLHWVDQTSEDFLAGFVDELPSVPVLLLVDLPPRLLPAMDRQVVRRPAVAAPAIAGRQRADRRLDSGRPGSGPRRRRSPPAATATRSSLRSWPGPAGTPAATRRTARYPRRSSRCWRPGSTG